MGHKYVPDSLKPPANIPRDYFVPNQGPDRDMVTTAENLKNAEEKLGPWNVNQLMLEEFVGIDAEIDMAREPLLTNGAFTVTAAPTPKDSWP